MVQVRRGEVRHPPHRFETAIPAAGTIGHDCEPAIVFRCTRFKRQIVDIAVAEWQEPLFMLAQLLVAIMGKPHVVAQFMGERVTRVLA